MQSYDLIIIGAGAAGMTAGIYAMRSNLKTLMLSKDIGGTGNIIMHLENWPGFKGTGKELMEKFYAHLKNYHAEVLIEDVKSIEKKGREFFVMTEKKEIKSKAIIIATGTEKRRLKIPGEEKFNGKGVSYCATCDGFFFKGKEVAVIGGSDCAANSAMELAEIAKKVYVIYRGEKLRCEAIALKKIEKKKNIEIIYNAIPEKINGERKVESITISQNSKIRELKIDGVFIEIGSTALTSFAEKLKIKLDKENQIIVNEKMESSVPGVFAAGDVTNFPLKQVLVASSQGAVAAKSAGEYLKK